MKKDSRSKKTNTKSGFFRKLTVISCCIIAGIITICTFSYAKSKPSLSPELKSLENKAEKGDTAALHKLLKFYDENSAVVLEIEEIIDPYGNEIAVEDTGDEPYDEALNELYLERLNHWMNKGVAIDDPVAKRMKGMRLYYEDEAAAIPYLAELAEKGDGQAALFCGSACMNQDKGKEAFKYLNMAYQMGVPSAGWHLASCYFRGIGTKADKAKAIEVMRHSALLDYPEAVLEMKRIEPDNSLWQNKIDSLGIDFPDYVIIDD